MRFINKVNNCLNNECGGPNIETLIGIGIAIAIGVALYAFGGTLHKSYSRIVDFIKTRTKENAEIKMP